MAGLLPAPGGIFSGLCGVSGLCGEGGGEGGTPRDLVVILFRPPPPHHPPLPPGLVVAASVCVGGQTLVNDDDSIIGACGGLGQTNAEQMPKEEGRRTRTLPHIDTLKQRAPAVA